MDMKFKARMLSGEAAHDRRLALGAIDGMRCDHSLALIGCLTPPSVSPRIYVPSKTQMAPGHANLRMTTPLHYCDAHVGTLTIDAFLTDKIKADFETAAKRARPIDFKCDFDNAFIHYVNIFTPEYMAYVAKLDRGLVAEFGGVQFRGRS
jgi:hypothetical protein